MEGVHRPLGQTPRLLLLRPTPRPTASREGRPCVPYQENPALPLRCHSSVADAVSFPPAPRVSVFLCGKEFSLPTCEKTSFLPGHTTEAPGLSLPWLTLPDTTSSKGLHGGFLNQHVAQTTHVIAQFTKHLPSHWRTRSHKRIGPAWGG